MTTSRRKASSTAAARRSKKGPKALSGPKSLFRNKLRSPFTFNLTARGLALETRLRLAAHVKSRGDLYELLMVEFGDELIRRRKEQLKAEKAHPAA